MNSSTAADRLAEYRLQNRLFEFEHQGVKWSYRKGGTGETLLMLPGGEYLADAGFEWILAFERHYQVITPNYPIGLIKIASVVAGVQELLDREGLEHVNVLGTSFGGMVAQKLVHTAPNRVANLVLSQTIAPDPSYGERLKKRLNLFGKLPAGIVHFLLIKALDRDVKNEPEAPFWKAYLREIYGTPPEIAKAILISSYSAIIDYCQNERFNPRDLSGWPGRILITEAGQDEKIGSESQSGLIGLYPAAQIHTFAEAGHMLGSERRAEFVQVVSEFLSGDQI